MNRQCEPLGRAASATSMPPAVILKAAVIRPVIGQQRLAFGLQLRRIEIEMDDHVNLALFGHGE